MKIQLTLPILAACAALAAVPQARAGIADSPLPVLQAGATTQFLYSVPGAYADTVLATFFSCTSTDTAPQQVGVEVFGSAGGGSLNARPSARFS